MFRYVGLSVTFLSLIFINSVGSVMAQTLPGDSNGDGIVDGKDYTRWLNRYQHATTLGAADGDFNGDGIVDGRDYVTWSNNYGRTAQVAYKRTSPWPVPGRVQAEDYDAGGQNMAYHDTTSTNIGNSTYRSEDVDLRDYSGTVAIANAIAGEWVEYTMNNSTARNYNITINGSTIYSGRFVNFTWNGVEIARIPVPITADWGTYQTSTVTSVPVPAGDGVLRMTFEVDHANIDWFEFTVASPNPTVTPSPTPAISYPRVLQSSNSNVRFTETQAPQGNKIFVKVEVIDPAITDEIRFDWSLDGGTIWNREYDDPFFIGGDNNGIPNGYVLPSNSVTFTTRFYYNGYNSNFGSTLVYNLGGVTPTSTPAPTTAPTATPSPTTAPSSTPAPTSSSSDNRLTWRPPTLVNPITITLGTGNTSTTLDNTKDYIIKLPNSRKGTTTIKNGRNVVVIGGHISIPYKDLGGGTLRAIYIKDEGSGQMNGRIVHLEGILFDASADNGTGGHGDAISIDAESAIVQVQNVRVDGMWGGQNTAYYDHSDFIQPWGGVKELRVDKFTGNTNYQGMQIPIDNYGPIEKSDLRRVNLSYKPKEPNNGGYLIWLFHTEKGATYTPCHTSDYYPINFSEVYLHDFKPGRNFGNSIWPEDLNEYCGPDVSNGVAKWTSVPNITGEIRSGRPPGGDFVPAGSVGVNYQSPGYK